MSASVELHHISTQARVTVTAAQCYDIHHMLNPNALSINAATFRPRMKSVSSLA